MDTQWNLWFHSIKDNNWKLDSYKKICSIGNMFDYLILKETIQPHHLYNSMLFLMKDTICPIWEDPRNREGCCLSFKVPYNKVKEEWDKITLYCINDLICCKKDLITGVSIAPKKEFNIIKIWLNESNSKLLDTIDYYDPHVIKSNMQWKQHVLQ